MIKFLYLYVFVCSCFVAGAQAYVVRDIKSFGARGDGKTNDHAAFEKAAAFFNARGGRGKLVISAGEYIVGKQVYTAGLNGAAAFKGFDVLHFEHVKNLAIEGSGGAKLKYAAGFRFGTFNPKTKKPHNSVKDFYDYTYVAFLGHCIYFSSSEDVTVKNLELDGNSQTFVLGGNFGDVGRQIQHYGIFIANSREVKVENIYAHHFALDGISIANSSKKQSDDIKVSDSRFEYNGRCGLSWIGGNDLKVKNSKFNFNAQGRISSAPAAGVDIEAEWGPIRNGKFENCEFIDNKGVGLLADSGDSGDCVFKDCVFWGTDAWSIWADKPNFTFRDSKIYGSIANGYDSPNDRDATRFINCHFEDKPYNGKEAYGEFLVLGNNVRRMSFTGCTFTSNKKKLMWMTEDRGELKPEEKYQFNNCRFVIRNNNLPQNDYVAVISGLRYQNCVFEFAYPGAKKKGYHLNSHRNTDAGNNRILYTQ